jgi:hypothetical protein
MSIFLDEKTALLMHPLPKEPDNVGMCQASQQRGFAFQASGLWRVGRANACGGEDNISVILAQRD